MKIDDTEVPEAVIGCWKDLLDKSGDADLPALSKKHKELSVGFRPGKAPAREPADSRSASFPDRPDRLEELGFKLSDGRTHLSRTMMLAELSDSLRVPHFTVAARTITLNIPSPTS